MASQTQGIQQLLAAEKRAAEKVSEARKRKNRRLKQAKEEAQTEIEKYKSERYFFKDFQKNCFNSFFEGKPNFVIMRPVMLDLRETLLPELTLMLKLELTQ